MHRGPDHILDELLVLRSQDGVQASLELLLARWRDRLYGRARWLCGQQDGADEITQRAMIAIARGIGRLDDPSAFGGWAMRIVANKASDWLRERKRARPRQVSLDTGAAIEVTPHPGARRDDELNRRVGFAMERLAPDRRAILVLHYGHGVSVEGLARTLGIPTGTAKSRLFNARRDLARLLERHKPWERTEQ